MPDRHDRDPIASSAQEGDPDPHCRDDLSAGATQPHRRRWPSPPGDAPRATDHRAVVPDRCTCQSAAGSAPPIGGQSAPGLEMTIGSKHERIRFPQGAPVGGSRDRHRALAVGYRHFVSGAVTSSRRSIRVVRKLRPVIATTWASSASRSRAALPRSGSANNSCHSAGARLLVTAVLLRS